MDTEGVALASFVLVVALVAPVDQFSPGAALVVPHQLTIVLLVKILIIIDLVKPNPNLLALAKLAKLAKLALRSSYFFPTKVNYQP